MGITSVLSPVAIVRQLRLGAEASTFNRLGSSRHVADLRLIFSVSIIIMIVSAILALAFCFQHQVMTNWQEVRDRESGWIWPRLWFSAVADSGAFIGAIGAIGCGVLAWTYQRGSARLGVVDLFACEIATLCRVVAVSDTVHRYIDLFENGPQAGRPHVIDGESPDDTSHFTSQESYFPVFDTSVKDLQALEADVVKHVTAFYTYMKVMRDLLRRLAGIKTPEPRGPRDDDWHRAICSVLYMLFLGLESARKAIKDLVEFEPKQAEDMITILLSELLAYGFLREQFRGDIRQRRLEARDESYRQEIPALHRLVIAGEGPQWDAAKDLSAEMMKRFDRVLVDTPTVRARRATLGLPAAVS
ncbi:MAG TPA: hypothetical protein VKI44_35920 [Acetobacteraceae bacterium]|nr:hypothetical protein [Acetobacteraceae bacterium]